MARQNAIERIDLNGVRVAGEDAASVLAHLRAFAEADPSWRPGNPFRLEALLDRTALQSPREHAGSDTVLILNLESIELVRISAEHSGAIRWFCGIDPRELVGPLLDHYRGTYFRPHRRELIYSSDTDLEVYSLGLRTRMTPALLAAVCLAREAGIAQAVIGKVLNARALRASSPDQDRRIRTSAAGQAAG